MRYPVWFVIFPCNPPISQQPLGQTGQTQVLRKDTTHKEAYFPQKNTRGPLFYMWHLSKPNTFFRSPSPIELVILNMWCHVHWRALPLTNLGNKYTIVCYGHVKLFKIEYVHQPRRRTKMTYCRAAKIVALHQVGVGTISKAKLLSWRITISSPLEYVFA